VKAADLLLHHDMPQRQQEDDDAAGAVKTNEKDERVSVRLEPLEMEANKDTTCDNNNVDGVFRSAPWHHGDGDSGDAAALAGDHHHGQVLGGDLKSAVLGVIKGMVGPAILYLPHGFAQAGWMVAVPVLFLSAALFLASSACLLQSWQLVSGQAVSTVEDLENNKDDNIQHDSIHHDATKPQPAPLSYPELAHRAFGRRGETWVKVGIAAMQSGVCLTYLIFVPQNLSASLRSLTGETVSPLIFLVAMLLLQIPLSWIQDIRKLTVTNALANALILYGLLTCLGFASMASTASSSPPGTDRSSSTNDTMTDERPTIGVNNEGDDPILAATTSIVSDPPMTAELHVIVQKLYQLTPFNSSGWFLFIGTSVLLFEGSITLLIPLQEAVAKPRDRQRFPRLYSRVILGIISFYTFFGLFCWTAFGNDVNTVLTVSLPPGIMATTVQVAYSVAVIFTFPLQNFPSLEIACAAISSISLHHHCHHHGRGGGGRMMLTRALQSRNLMASVLVCLLGLVAVLTMERLDKVVSLMGGLLGCPLAFCFPPLIQNQLDSSLSRAKRFVNKMVAFLGLGAMVIASVATILAW